MTTELLDYTNRYNNIYPGFSLDQIGEIRQHIVYEWFYEMSTDMPFLRDLLEERKDVLGVLPESKYKAEVDSTLGSVLEAIQIDRRGRVISICYEIPYSEGRWIPPGLEVYIDYRGCALYRLSTMYNNTCDYLRIQDANNLVDRLNKWESSMSEVDWYKAAELYTKDVVDIYNDNKIIPKAGMIIRPIVGMPSSTIMYYTNADLAIDPFDNLKSASTEIYGLSCSSLPSGIAVHGNICVSRQHLNRSK